MVQKNGSKKLTKKFIQILATHNRNNIYNIGIHFISLKKKIHIPECIS